MRTQRKSIRTLSYGLTHPRQLFEKLKSDSEKLDTIPHPHDVFNFVVTAAVLAEWIQKHYETAHTADPFRSPSKEQEEWMLPTLSEKWITDTSCLPNPANGVSRHTRNVLSICAHTANASKHFHWADKGHVETIGADPPIRDWYQFFFTSREPDLYVTYRGENYGLQQIRGVLLQFYSGLLNSLESSRPEGKA